MDAAADPFLYHPDLREKISDPLMSPSRTLTTAKLARMAVERGLPHGWRNPDSEREAERTDFLASHTDSDLWVFAYGSLMWDPGVRFEEVRRAHLPRHARRFILKDIYGGRGTIEVPGLMVTLDEGTGCDGLAFRIARMNIEEETDLLWRRERIGPAYRPVFVTATAGDRQLTALTFVADYEVELIDAGISQEQQVEYCATGTGFRGSTLDYLRNIARQFAALGIRDDEVTELLREAEAYVIRGARRRRHQAAGTVKETVFERTISDG